MPVLQLLAVPGAGALQLALVALQLAVLVGLVVLQLALPEGLVSRPWLPVLWLLSQLWCLLLLWLVLEHGCIPACRAQERPVSVKAAALSFLGGEISAACTETVMWL